MTRSQRPLPLPGNPLLAGLCSLLLGCTGGDVGLSTGGSQSGDFAGDSGVVSLATATFVVLDIADGSTTALAAIADLDDVAWRGERVVFRRVRPSGQDEFLISVFEITQEQWTRLGGGTPWTAVPGSVVGSNAVAADRPAFGVSYTDIQALVGGYRTSVGVRLALPTAVQWSAACGGSGTYTWGSTQDRATVTDHAAVYQTLTPSRGPRPVGERAANGNGLYDLHGNVWEWTEPGNELRGGSWFDSLQLARTVNALADTDANIDSDSDHALFGCRLLLIP